VCLVDQHKNVRPRVQAALDDSFHGCRLMLPKNELLQLLVLLGEECILSIVPGHGRGYKNS
jgi:hypothetical protein